MNDWIFGMKSVENYQYWWAGYSEHLLMSPRGGEICVCCVCWYSWRSGHWGSPRLHPSPLRLWDERFFLLELSHQDSIHRGQQPCDQEGDDGKLSAGDPENPTRMVGTRPGWWETQPGWWETRPGWWGPDPDDGNPTRVMGTRPGWWGPNPDDRVAWCMTGSQMTGLVGNWVLNNCHNY